MADSKAVILIGMPGAGKSTIGVMLAKLLAKPFVDTDLMIQQLCGTTLQHHLDEFGFESLRNLEHRVLLTGGFQNKVVATGGSVVYSTAGMTRLKHEGLCVFLDVPLAVLTRRVNNMTCDRVYARAKPTTEALKILYECRGTQFDENLVLAFIQTIGLYPPGSIVELHNNCVGLVVATNDRSRHLPKVLILRDEDRQVCKHRYVDLSLTLSGELSTHYQIKNVQRDGYSDIFLRDCFQQGLLLHL